MKIVIAGAEEVGTHLANKLSAEVQSFLPSWVILRTRMTYAIAMCSTLIFSLA